MEALENNFRSCMTAKEILQFTVDLIGHSENGNYQVEWRSTRVDKSANVNYTGICKITGVPKWESFMDAPSNYFVYFDPIQRWIPIHFAEIIRAMKEECTGEWVKDPEFGFLSRTLEWGNLYKADGLPVQMCCECKDGSFYIFHATAYGISLSHKKPSVYYKK